MVLLAAAVCNKSGKALLSRQFVEMSRPRIEGLLAAFPKLMGSGSSSGSNAGCVAQHTFVETESVRYVYQPLERLYVLLITTKASNILEDLETLRLFARVIPEYARGMDEKDVVENAFALIFAFDEIVALGYRESVNLAQIRTFTEMDSHEEKVFIAVRTAQEREAKDAMKRKAKEMDRARRDAAKRGVRPTGMGSGGGGHGYNSSSGGYAGDSNSSAMHVLDSAPSAGAVSSRAAAASAGGGLRAAASGGGKALKLGSKSRDVDVFVDQLRTEGEQVASVEQQSRGSSGAGSGAVVAETNAMPRAAQGDVHVRIEEKLSVEAGRDGGLQSMELHGILHVKVNNEEKAACRLLVAQMDAAGRPGGAAAQMQTHPNIDKKNYLASNWVQLKQLGKPFPVGQEVGVLKWRLTTNDEAAMPIAINCWPTETAQGCDVNVDLELQDQRLELRDVVITLPIPAGYGAPRVNEADGDYTVARGHLEWCLPVIDKDNVTATLEFSLNGGVAADFFPIACSFHATSSYCGISVTEIRETVGEQDVVRFSSECLFQPDVYRVQ